MSEPQRAQARAEDRRDLHAETELVVLRKNSLANSLLHLELIGVTISRIGELDVDRPEVARLLEVVTDGQDGRRHLRELPHPSID